MVKLIPFSTRYEKRAVCLKQHYHIWPWINPLDPGDVTIMSRNDLAWGAGNVNMLSWKNLAEGQGTYQRIFSWRDWLSMSAPSSWTVIRLNGHLGRGTCIISTSNVGEMYHPWVMTGRAPVQGGHRNLNVPKIFLKCHK